MAERLECENLGFQPYSFEPEYSESEMEHLHSTASSNTSTSDTSSIISGEDCLDFSTSVAAYDPRGDGQSSADTHDTSTCPCGKCETMATKIESVCCRRCNFLKNKIAAAGCVTDVDDFKTINIMLTIRLY
jgi:hypothetical protein